MDIGIGKTTVTLRLIGGTAFAAGALAMWRVYPIFAGLTLAFVLAASWFGFRLLMDFRPGLTVGPTGLWINRKIGTVDNVTWADIIGFRLVRYGHDWQLVVDVAQPEAYRGKGNGGLKGALASWSESSFGSPVRLNASLLALDRDYLVRTLENYRSGGHF
jgi:hypothetical protein